MENTLLGIDSSFYFKMADSLESKGWFCQDLNLEEDPLNQLISYARSIEQKELFIDAAIGNQLDKNINHAIRRTQIYWISDWQSSPVLSHFQLFFKELITFFNRSFFLSLKRFETQLAYYQKGDFYKKHLDQLAKTRHRQVTVIFYLNDCPGSGELILYNRYDKKKKEMSLEAKKGRLVIFFSGQIYHEVGLVNSDRFSLTTWLRDDEILPFI